MFADDTKLMAAIRPQFKAEDRAKLQEDIDRITVFFYHPRICLIDLWSQKF